MLLFSSLKLLWVPLAGRQSSQMNKAWTLKLARWVTWVTALLLSAPISSAVSAEMISSLQFRDTHGWHVWLGFVTAHAFIVIISHLVVSLENDAMLSSHFPRWCLWSMALWPLFYSSILHHLQNNSHISQHSSRGSDSCFMLQHCISLPSCQVIPLVSRHQHGIRNARDFLGGNVCERS